MYQLRRLKKLYELWKIELSPLFMYQLRRLKKLYKFWKIEPSPLFWKIEPSPLFIILAFYFLLLTCLYSAFEFKPPAARPISMGGAYVGLSDDTNAIDYNPAGLRQISSFLLSSNYSLLYSVEGLNYSQFKIALPLNKYGCMGIGYSDFGPSEYKERIFVLSHSIGQLKSMLFGYSIKLMNVRIQEYGSDSVFGLDAGILANISNKLNLGIVVKNINGPKISNGREKLDEEFSAGILYRPLNNINFVLDLNKVLGQITCVNIGTEFNVVDYLALRIGVQTNPSKYNMGFGINYNKIFFDYCYSYNDTLSGTHLLSLLMKFDMRNKEKFKTEYIEIEKNTVRKININAATVEKLATLPGIGEKIAKNIINYRLKFGEFKSIEDLLNVPRISVKIFEKIKGFVMVEDERNKQETENIIQLQESTETVTSPVVKLEQESQLMELTEKDKININEADFQQLVEIGFTTIQSQNILRFKNKNGLFSVVEDLLKVPGISEKILNEVKDNFYAK